MSLFEPEGLRAAKCTRSYPAHLPAGSTATEYGMVGPCYASGPPQSHRANPRNRAQLAYARQRPCPAFGDDCCRQLFDTRVVLVARSATLDVGQVILRRSLRIAPMVGGCRKGAPNQ